MKILYAGPDERLLCNRCGEEITEPICSEGELDFYFCDGPCQDYVDVAVVRKSPSPSYIEPDKVS